MAKAYTSRAAGLKAVRLDVDPEEHATLEALAFVAGLPMSQYVRRLVTDHARANRASVAGILQARAGAARPPAEATPPAPEAPTRRKAPR
jgi:hypothetical protein